MLRLLNKFHNFTDRQIWIFSALKHDLAQIIVQIFQFFSGVRLDLMLEVEVQAVVFRPVHDRQVHALRTGAVRIPLGLVSDTSQLFQTFLLKGERLVGQRDRLIGQSRIRLRVQF